VTRRVTLRIAAGLTLACLLLAGALVPVSGYIEQSLTEVRLSAPNVVKCGRAATITAQVRATDSGKPIGRQVVRWSLEESKSGDRLTDARTLTDAEGTTSVKLRFGSKGGSRVVRASVAGNTPQITVRCRRNLPATAPAPLVDPDQAAPAVMLPPTDPGSGGTPAATSLRIERLGIDLPVVEGDGDHVTDGAANHYAGTAWPGEGSNTYLYGHARQGQFLELWKARRGDRIEVDISDGSVAVYEVSEIDPLVPWDAFELLAPTDDEILTLQTCLDYAETAPRFVVIATLVGVR
jgi:LPXTG-site transpeptidase (sortase) family protein